MQPLTAFCLTLFSSLLSLSLSAVIKHTFVVSFIGGTPDGVRHNNILGINGSFPGPLIEGFVGDTLEVTVINNIQGQNVTIHWHGFFQRGTPFADGPSYITQCPIKEKQSQVYSFNFQNPGTYWYHSHLLSQYSAGLWGAIIVRGKAEVYGESYKSEILLTVSDWYHHTYLENEEFYLSPRSGGVRPFPDSVLINGLGRYDCAVATKAGFYCNSFLQNRPVFKVVAGQSYRLRLVSTAADATFIFSIDDHLLSAIEVDSVDVREPVTADHALIAAAQRYSFILNANVGKVGDRFLIRATVTPENLLYIDDPPNINLYPELLNRTEFQTVTAVLEYVAPSPSDPPGNTVIPFTTEPFYHVDKIDPAETKVPLSNPLNDLLLFPYDRQMAPVIAHHTVNLTITVGDFAGDGIRRICFNNMPFILPNQGLPLLGQMLRNQPYEASIEQTMTKIDYLDGVEIIVNNPFGGLHPVHLHGHNFFVVYKGEQDSGFYDPDKHTLNYLSMKRDTVIVNSNASTVIRFLADNPGFWTFHCHIDWHMISGLLWNFEEAADIARKNITIPQSAIDTCGQQGVWL